MVYVVERYLPGLARSDLLRGLSRLECSDESRRVGSARYLGSTIVIQDEACFCQFEAPSAAAVAEANRRAGLTFDRIVPAVTIRPTEGESGMSTHTTISMPVRLRRGRVVVLVVAVIAAAAIAAVIVAAGSRSHPQPVNTSLSASEQRYVDAISAMSKEELSAAFGTASATASSTELTPNERRYVEGITALTYAQLAAAFGTGR